MDEPIRRAIENARGCVLVAFKSGSGKEIEKSMTDRVIANKKKAEQAGAGQPATSPESKWEDSQKPQPEPEGISR